MKASTSLMIALVLFFAAVLSACSDVPVEHTPTEAPNAVIARLINSNLELLGVADVSCDGETVRVDLIPDVDSDWTVKKLRVHARFCDGDGTTTRTIDVPGDITESVEIPLIELGCDGERDIELVVEVEAEQTDDNGETRTCDGTGRPHGNPDDDDTIRVRPPHPEDGTDGAPQGNPEDGTDGAPQGNPEDGTDGAPQGNPDDSDDDGASQSNPEDGTDGAPQGNPDDSDDDGVPQSNPEDGTDGTPQGNPDDSDDDGAPYSNPDDSDDDNDDSDDDNDGDDDDNDGDDDGACGDDDESDEGVCAVGGDVIYAGQSEEAGRYEVASDDDEITVTVYGAGDWAFETVHLYVGADAIPTNGAGVPAPGQFPYKAEFNAATSEYTFHISLDELGAACGDSLNIAVHTESIRVDEAGIVTQSETGWGFGDQTFESDARWGWSSSFSVDCCEDAAE